MGIVIRQSILTSIISYIGVVIGYINLLYLFPKYLDTEQIGLARTIQDTAMLFTPFAVFGLGQSIIKFFPHFSKDNKQANNFVTLILTLGLATYGIFITVFLLFEGFFTSFFLKNAPAIIDYIPLVLWLTFFLLFITLLEQYSRSLLNVALPSFLKDIGIRICQAVLVLLYFSEVISFDQFLAYSVWIYLALLIVLAACLWVEGRLRFSFGYSSIPKDKIKEIFTFSILSFVGTSSMILIGKMDSVMVTGMLGLASNAIYTTAFYMATVIEIPKRAITTTASPLIARAFERNDLAEVHSIYQKVSINQLIIGALLLIGVWANLPNIFNIMPKGETFSAGMYVVIITGFGKLLDMAFGPSSEIIGLSKHYWFNLVVITILAGIVVTCNYIFIPNFGIEGAAYSSCIALLMYNVVKFFFIYARFGLQPFTFNTVKVIMISAVVMMLNFVLPRHTNTFIDIGYRSAIITLVFGSMIVATKSSDEVNKIGMMAVDLIRQKIGRK